MSVSDHALVRYIARRKNVDVDDLAPFAETDRERLAALSLWHGLDIESTRNEIAQIVKRGIEMRAKAV